MPRLRHSQAPRKSQAPHVSADARCNQIARFIASFVTENHRMPSTAVIGEAFGISGTRVRQLLDQLREDGILELSRDGYLRLAGGEYVPPPLR